MRNIRSLADQIRDELKGKEQPEKEITKKVSEEAEASKPKSSRKVKADPHEEQAAAFFQAIEDFKPKYSEKSMIRLDARTINLLKRIKLTKNIDMNRFIVYSLHRYLEQHPWLAEHIQETIKNTEL
ncbi:hypothetical protein [Sphingobacterium bambusae]|uniref:DUF3408 domain-containing protein n=1 Tax=Sphingobacterium bambusae TaxID=662858 RepID=A0ABW6BHQ0_9SPHI|nr:hypothetical protein [Sphingobacterium bambusae]WPL49391.1 hypothetical protein SCB77_02855 [Sphingobacterium bambusae]